MSEVGTTEPVPVSQVRVLRDHASQGCITPLKWGKSQSVNHCFGRHTSGALRGQLKSWDFTHTNSRTERIPAVQVMQGQVMARHRTRDPLRLPSSAYNIGII